jgi:hypothetical protein
MAYQKKCLFSAPRIPTYGTPIPAEPSIQGKATPIRIEMAIVEKRVRLETKLKKGRADQKFLLKCGNINHESVLHITVLNSFKNLFNIGNRYLQCRLLKILPGIYPERSGWPLVFERASVADPHKPWSGTNYQGHCLFHGRQRTYRTSCVAYSISFILST